MKQPPAKQAGDGKVDGRAWPWWEPYLFTAFALAALLVLAVIFDFIARIPYLQPTLFGVMTITAVVQAFRRPLRPPMIVGELVVTLVLGCVSLGSFVLGDLPTGACCAALSAVWLGVTVRAAMVRHEMKQVRSARLDQAVEDLESRLQGHEWSD